MVAHQTGTGPQVGGTHAGKKKKRNQQQLEAEDDDQDEESSESRNSQETDQASDTELHVVHSSFFVFF